MKSTWEMGYLVLFTCKPFRDYYYNCFLLASKEAMTFMKKDWHFILCTSTHKWILIFCQRPTILLLFCIYSGCQFKSLCFPIHLMGDLFSNFPLWRNGYSNLIHFYIINGNDYPQLLFSLSWSSLWLPQKLFAVILEIW